MIRKRITELHELHRNAATREERVAIELLVAAEVEKERHDISSEATADVILSYLNTAEPVRVLLAGLIERIHELESELFTAREKIQSLEIEYSENQEKT